jgi:hypothetical protein
VQHLLHVQGAHQANAKKLPLSSSPATLAPASVRSRKIDSGKTGDSTRSSITRKAASRVADAASSASVRVAPQPYCGAWEIASTSSTSPAVLTIAPDTSKRRRSVLPAYSVSKAASLSLTQSLRALLAGDLHARAPRWTLQHRTLDHAPRAAARNATGRAGS